MYGRQSALASYGRIANAQTDPLQQIVMLYDGAIKFLNLAADDIERGDLVAKAEHTGRALDIVSYLQSVLDFSRGGDVAPVLDALYNHVNATTLRASLKLDRDLMLRAAALLAPVRDSWSANITSNAAAATAAAPPALLGTDPMAKVRQPFV